MSGAGQDHLPRRLWWLLAGLTFAWGFNWTAMKVALAEVPPWTFRTLCLGLGSAVLFLALRLGGQRLAVPPGQWGRLAMLAFFNITCWNVLIAFGMTMIPSGRAAILAYTMPALAIPLSLVAGVLVISLFGQTLNTMTLGGLTIAIGALVDDAIIDVENVFRRLRENARLPEGQRRSAFEVIDRASVEVRTSILFATLIIVLVFVLTNFIVDTDSPGLEWQPIETAPNR